MAVTRLAAKKMAQAQQQRDADDKVSPLKQATIPEMVNMEEMLIRRKQPDRDEMQWVESSLIESWLVDLLVIFGKKYKIGVERSLKILMDSKYNVVVAATTIMQQSGVEKSGKFSKKLRV